MAVWYAEEMRLVSLGLASGAAVVAFLMAGAACVDVSGFAGGVPPLDAGLDADAGAVVTGSLAIRPAALDFGPAGCGTPVPAQSVTIENTSETLVHFEASLPEASGFVLGGQRLTTVSGDIPSHGLTVLTIGVASLRTLGPLATKLSIISGEQVAEVPIRVTGLGAKLEVEPKIVDFGDVYYQVPSTTEVVLRNTGTEPVTVESLADLGADFTVAPGTLPLVVGPNITTKVSLTLAAGSAGASITNDVTLVTGATPVCGDPTMMSIRARRVNADLTLNPGTVDFGPQGCLTTPAAKMVTLTNYAPVVIDVAAASLPLGSRYDISPSTATQIPAANGPIPGKVVFTLTPKPVALPLGSADETLLLDCGPKGMKSATVHVDVRGVLLSFLPTRLLFSLDQTKYFAVKNVGNVNAVTTYLPPNAAWTVTPGDTIFPNATSNMVVTLNMSGSGTYDGVITTALASGGPLCAPAATVRVEEK